MFIYRIENLRGEGFYQSSDMNDIVQCPKNCMTICFSDQRPSAWDDLSDEHSSKVGNPDVLFGFLDFRDLSSWFDFIDWCEPCQEHFDEAFEVCVYEVEDAFVFPGGKQLIFDRTMSACVSRMSPSEALDFYTARV